MKIRHALQNVHAIAIETAPFIYYVEKHPTYGEKIRNVFQVIEQMNIPIVASTITLTEVLTKPIKTGDVHLVNIYRAFLSHHKAIQLYAISSSIAEKAAELRAKYNLRTPDALHIATAIESNSDAFLTNDMGLKRITELQVLILDELEIK